jgi:hypothetical protein
MKKLLLLLLFPLTLFGQTQQEGSESVSEWTSIQYVDLDNDIISSSNLSFGFLGEFNIFSYNLAYQWKNKNHSNGLFVSNTPSFKYTKFGYNYIREKELESGFLRTNTYSLSVATTSLSGTSVTISPFFNQTYEKNSYKFGYTLFVKDFSWDGYELLGEYMPSAAETKFSIMVIGMKEFQMGRWELRPEIFMMSSIRTHFTHLEETEYFLDIWYWNSPNLTTYFGTTLQYNVTDMFTFATKFRSSYRYDQFDIQNGFSKTTPYIISIGANYDF